jgi:Protein of unknown function (DUF2948)
MTAPLRLRAEDEEDFAVLSALLQDALVPVADMAFLPDERRFALVANRFCWEHQSADGRAGYERTLTGVAVEGVTAVKTRGFTPREHDRILEVLSIRFADGAIVIDFSADACLRLEVEQALCRLEDIGEPWPTPWRPSHPIDDV